MQTAGSNLGPYAAASAQEVTERELPGLASRLEAAVQGLEDAIIELRGRLEPVRSSVPQVNAAEPMSSPHAVGSPFGERLADQIARIRSITGSAKSLISELAV